MTASVALYAVTFDCTDAATLAGFWAGVLDVPVDKGASLEFASIGTAADGPTPPHWMFVRVPDPTPGKNRVHVDLVAGDRAAEVDRIVGLGARVVAELDEDGSRWTTLADPEGNLFDVVAA